MRFKCIVAMY